MMLEIIAAPSSQVSFIPGLQLGKVRVENIYCFEEGGADKIKL